MNFRLMLSIVLLSWAGFAHGQDFPTRPIHIVIPYAPGGGSDILARPVGQDMSERLKQPVVIENKGGAGGNIGAQVVAKSAPDGYTLLLANNSHVINPYIYKDPGYDMAKDFAPVSLLATSPMIIVVHKSVEVKTLAELVAYAKKNPGKMNLSTAGIGTPGHLAPLVFFKLAGIDIVPVAYKGSGPAVMALLQKEVDVHFATPAVVAPHIKTGDFRALGVTTKTRFAAFPDVPTVAESGIPGMADFNMAVWWGVLAPAKTDPKVLDKLNAAVTAAVKDPKMRERWDAQGMVPTSTTRAEFQAIINADLPKFEKVVKDNKITAE